jgi:hypothetical protein
MKEYLEQIISVKNFELLRFNPGLAKVKEIFKLFFKEKDLLEFDSLFTKFAAKYDETVEYLNYFKSFLQASFVKTCSNFQELKEELNVFEKAVQEQPILHINYPWRLEKIKKDFISLITSDIYLNILNKLYHTNKGNDDPTPEMYLEFGSLSFFDIEKLMNLSSEYLEQLFKYNDSSKLRKSLTLKDVETIFHNIDIEKELALFKYRYDSKMEKLFRIMGQQCFIKATLEFSQDFHPIYDFFELKHKDSTEQIEKFHQFYSKNESKTNFLELQKKYQKMRVYQPKEEEAEIPDLKTNLDLDNVNPLFLIIENHVNIIYFLQILSENIELTAFLMDIYKNFLDSFESKIDILNEEIQSGDYSIKNFHLVDCKHLIRHLKEVSGKNFNSDHQILMHFLTKNIIEGKVKDLVKMDKSNKNYPNYVRLVNSLSKNAIYKKGYNRHSEKDFLKDRYNSKRFVYSSFNCAMLRVKILNLVDIYLELQTLYKRSIDVYQQSLELIQSIMLGSEVKFFSTKNQSIQIEIVRFHFEIKRDGEKRGEGALKISDLYSRSLIRKEQADNSGPEFSLFINLYRHLKNILELFKNCHSYGFDIDKRFVSRKVRVKDNDLSEVEALYLELKGYFEDLSNFIKVKRKDPSYFFLNYLSGRQIRAIRKDNVSGVLNYLKWWDRSNPEESFDPYSLETFGIKLAKSSSETQEIERVSNEFKNMVSKIDAKYRKEVVKESEVNWISLSFKQKVEAVKSYLSFLQIKKKYPRFVYRNRDKFDALDKILVIKTQDYFKAMLSLYNETSTPKPKLHQILFCQSDTSELEAETFVLRALNDPLKRLFCILGFDKLSYSVSKVILSVVSSHISQSNTEKEFYLAILISRGHNSLKDSSKIAKKYEIQKEANDEFLDNYGEYVTSEGPGMGKTFYIEKNLRTKSDNPSENMFSLMLSGAMSSYKMKNLGSDLSILNRNADLDLHLKLSYFTNMDHADYMISVFLFKVTFFRIIEDRNNFSRVPSATKIFIEVSNSFENFLEKSISYLRLLKKTHIEDFNIQNYLYDENNFASDDFCFNYIYMKHLKDRSLNNGNVFINDINAYGKVLLKKIFYKKTVKKVRNFKPLARVSFKKEKYSPQEAEDLFNDFYLNSPNRNKKNTMSFTKFKLFLRIIKDQFIKFIFMEMLYPANLGNCKIAAKNWRLDILKTVINSTIEFLNSNVAILKGQNSAIKMADKISNMEKEEMQMRLVEEFQKRINCIDKWEDKNPTTVLLLRDRLFLAIKDIEKLKEEEKQLNALKEEKENKTSKKIAIDPEAEEEILTRLEYKNNVLRFLKYYEVPTISKTIKIKNPRYNPESQYAEDKKEEVEIVIKERFKDNITDLESLGTQSFLYRLLGLTGRKDINLEELVYEAKIFENKGYEINLDNFLKISLILQRTKLRIPVVCIGETGCGKTFMIKFVSSVLMNVSEFCHETLHTGYTELELKMFIMDKVVRGRKLMEERKAAQKVVEELKLKKYTAKGNRKKFTPEDKKNLKEAKKKAEKSDEIWIFFDEFNTSVLQNYICEIMSERVSSLLPFDPKVNFQ